MTKSQEFEFYWPTWRAAQRAFDWKTLKGRLVGTRPDHFHNPTATALMHAIWDAADILSRQAHRAITPEDLRHAANVVATGKTSSKTFTTYEVTRFVAAMDLLLNPDSLDKMNDWLHPENAERRALLAAVERLGFNEPYIATVSSGKFGTRTWRNLGIGDLQQLVFTLQNRRRKRG